jgi:hypothetical protein
MTNLYARKLEKIYKKIGQIASKGRDNRLEYSKYVDELIGKGDFVALQETLNIFYQMDTLDITDVNDLKSKTWNEICFQTKSTFLTRLSKLYKQKKVYQQSYNIYSENPKVTNLYLSNRLSMTFSNTGLTPSINFSKSGEMINLEIYDDDINSVQIQKATWETDENGNDAPTSIRYFEDFQVSYFGNSFTSFNPSQLTIGDSFTMSMTTTKQFLPNQFISVTFSNNYIEGLIESYDKLTGETSITITNAVGSSTYSLWFVNYLSGPKNPTYSTNIPTSFGATYLITTTQKNNVTFDFEKYNYKLTVDRNPLVGYIFEVDIYDPNSSYLVQNKQYARLTGEKKSYIQAQKIGATFSVVFDIENPALSEDANLLNRYSDAINYLLS